MVLKNFNISVSIGKDKTQCDQTVMSSKITTTVPIFGHYVRFSLHDLPQSKTKLKYCLCIINKTDKSLLEKKSL